MKKSVRLLRGRDVKGPQFDPLIEDLEKTIARIDDLSGEQRSASKMRTGWADVIARLRLELRDLHMYRISRSGPSLMKWAPKAEQSLRLPHQTVGNSTLLASARAMVKVVALKPSLFTKQAGFPVGFLAEFRAAIRELEEAIAAAEENMRLLSRLTRELDRAITHGRRQQRLLDGVLRPLTHAEPSFGELWRNAWQIPETLGRPKKKNKKKQKSDDDEKEQDADATAPPAP